PSTWPCASTTTAPTGTSPTRQAASACCRANAISSASPARGSAGSGASVTSATVHPRLQGDAPGQAGDGFLEPLIELGVLVVAGLVQVGDAPFLDEAPGAAALVAVLWIPYPEGEAAGAPDQGKTRDVGIAVAHEDHLVERHAQAVFRDLA